MSHRGSPGGRRRRPRSWSCVVPRAFDDRRLATVSATLFITGGQDIASYSVTGLRRAVAGFAMMSQCCRRWRGCTTSSSSTPSSTRPPTGKGCDGALVGVGRGGGYSTVLDRTLKVSACHVACILVQRRRAVIDPSPIAPRSCTHICARRRPRSRRWTAHIIIASSSSYGERNGGYTRILRTMNRQGDNAKMGIIELV